MDKLHLRRQFLPPYLVPLARHMVVIGRALTVLEADFHEECSDGYNRLSAQPFGLQLDALDDLRPNEVYVCTGASTRYDRRNLRSGAHAA